MARMKFNLGSFLSLLTLLFILSVFVVIYVVFWTDKSGSLQKEKHEFLRSEIRGNIQINTQKPPKTSARDTRCSFHSCMNVYHCGYDDNSRISVYIYPLTTYTDKHDIPINLPISKEFREVLTSIADSPFYTDDPTTACLFIPSLDLLNQNNVRLKETGQVLSSLPWWNGGSNHLLINMLPGSVPDYSTVLEVNTGKAMIAGGGFSTWSYRRTFDVSIPVYNPLVTYNSLKEKSHLEERQWFLISAQTGLHQEYRDILLDISKEEPNFLLIDKCSGENKTWSFSKRCKQSEGYDYPQILQEGTFCLVIRGARMGQTGFSDALMSGCIPVVVADGFVLPFSEVLDWKRAAVIVREDDLEDVMDILRSFSKERIIEMRKQVQFYWKNYFSSMKNIILTTLQIINDRVFHYASKKYEDWNEIPNQAAVKNPLFLPLMPPSSQGFTAVILTYDRLESLFQVIHQVAKVPSLAKIVIVWNNQNKSPPNMSTWPNIGKPMKVVKTTKNKLSNRFFPYDEIETECILALDDDIIMLTADELECPFRNCRLKKQ